MQISWKAGSALAALSLLGLATRNPAQAQAPIVPTSYNSTPGESGGAFPNYFDDTGMQLTDGVLGANNWAADLENGPAYEWVGWLIADPEISFNFGQNVTINSVSIGFNRSEADGIFIPPSVNIGGTPFTLAPDALTDGTRGFLTFNGSWTGSNLNVALSDNDPGKWIFVDEVKFTSPVPEASTTLSFGLLLMFGVGGLAVSARRRKAQAAE